LSKAKVTIAQRLARHHNRDDQASPPDASDDALQCTCSLAWYVGKVLSAESILTSLLRLILERAAVITISICLIMAAIAITLTFVLITQLDRYGVLRVPMDSSTRNEEELEDAGVDEDEHGDGEVVPLLIAEK
jgi:hypothetical protein